MRTDRPHFPCPFVPFLLSFCFLASESVRSGLRNTHLMGRIVCKRGTETEETVLVFEPRLSSRECVV